MQTVRKIWCTYDEFFCDELSIKLLYEHKDSITEYADEKGNELKQREVIDWVLQEYYNHSKFLEYCRECKGKIPEEERQLYHWEEEYRRYVDEERLYILWLMGVEVTKIATAYGISRQAVYKKIKSFEEKRLQEFTSIVRVG